MPARARVVVAEQEVAVAADEVHRHAAHRASARSFARDVRAGFGRIVVADPGLEQVAEDVQRIGAAGFARRRSRPNSSVISGRVGIEVKVGDEKRGHAAIVERDSQALKVAAVVRRGLSLAERAAMPSFAVIGRPRGIQ